MTSVGIYIMAALAEIAGCFAFRGTPRSVGLTRRLDMPLGCVRHLVRAENGVKIWRAKPVSSTPCGSVIHK